MRKFCGKALLLLSMFIVSGNAVAASGWPSKYEGVMLQGFYWDSFKVTVNTKWSTLTEKADELSKYFKLIWTPNGGKPASSPSNGYDPVYWFTNYNSSWGTEYQLRTMIKTYKEKGTGIIADVVINHRSGTSNWTNFPKETWNGETYQLGPQHICSTDEVRNQAGQAKPTGAPDTGEDFNGSRDLDHTSAEVQRNCKAYCKFLLDDMGYSGFRLDMTKGYDGQYTKIYNQYSNPTYCVGEYWDGSYDALAAWIEKTGKTSAAFDFAFKYAVNKAFSSNDMTQLCWKANGTTDQPAGLIHFGYARYAVTFIDNHDTSRDDWNKFNGNVVAANAFMLCSPGTPCVFYPHYSANKAAIQKLISVRNAVGLHNESAVRVLKVSRDCYMAEVTGTKGKLVVRIGSTSDTPAGYTSSDVKASGNGYCVWSKVGVGGGDDPIVTPGKEFKVYFDNTQTKWTTPYIHYWGDSESSWPGVAMSKHKDNVWVYTVPAGTIGLIFNAGNGDATKTEDFVAAENHLYNKSGDQGVYGGGHDDPTPGNYPANVYLVGNINGQNWNSADAPRQDSASKGVYVWNGVKFDESAAGTDKSYFSFLTALDAEAGSWIEANNSDRYGAPEKDAAITINKPAQVKLFAVNVDAMGCNAWYVAPGTYTVTLDLSTMQVKVGTGSTIVNAIEENEEAVYFNLQGQRVENPEHGIYIMVRGSKVSKVMVK